MPASLAKDLIFLLGGVLLTLALESERDRLNGLVGPGQVSLLCFLIFVFVTGGYLAFRHYLGVLASGGKPVVSARRKSYDALKASLREGGTPARVYAEWLEKALHAVERFFGDGDMANRSVIQRAIGLSRPAALWTAPALDRCTLFAFIYPQAMLILGWAISGHAGPAERVLGLVDQPASLMRFAAMAAMMFAALAYFNCQKLVGELWRMHRHGLEHWLPAGLWFAGSLGSVAIVDRLLGVSVASVGGSLILSSAVVGAIAGDVLVAMACGFLAAAVATPVTYYGGVFLGTITAALACAPFGFASAMLCHGDNRWSRLRNRLRHSYLFWFLFLAAAAVVYIGLARLLPRTPAWPIVGPVILFYGLLSALNAPFLWLSIGLTRTLLWLGIERKGWWPYFYALLDAAMGVLGVMVLVAVMVVAVQLLDVMAVAGGGKPVLMVGPLVDGIGASLRKGNIEPEYWWVYTMLLSAMIPSLINLAIGGFSLLRGIPAASRHLHLQLPDGESVPPPQRTRIAAILTLQLMSGISLGVVAQFILLPWWIFGYVLPGLGFGVLDFAHQLVARGLPN